MWKFDGALGSLKWVWKGKRESEEEKESSSLECGVKDEYSSISERWEDKKRRVLW